MGKRIHDDDKTIIDVLFSPLKKAGSFIGKRVYDLKVRVKEKFPGKTKQSTAKARRRKEAIFYYSLIAFPLLQFLVFYVAVNFNSILLSFKEYRVTGGQSGYIWVGLKNYSQFFIDFFTGPNLKQIALNSLIVYGCGLFVGVPLAILFSFYLYKGFPLTGAFKVLLFLPSIISSVAMVLMYKYFADVGFPGAIQKLFGVKIKPPLSTASTRFGWIIFYNLFISFGANVIMYTSAMTRIPPSLTEYARIEGVSYTQELFKIVIPMIFPTITTFLVVGVAGIFTNQANVYTFYGTGAGTDITTFGYFLFGKVIAGRSTMAEYPYAAAAGIIFTFIAVPVTLLVKYLLEKHGPTVEY